MRKLAPMFVMTSIVALAGGTAFANTNDTGTPDNKTGSPTVSKNTNNPQALSYADKENAAKGTNARMDTPSAAGSSTTRSAVAAVDTDKELTTNDSRNDDSTANKKITKKAKHKKVAQNGSKTSMNPPVDATHPAAANSTSGMTGGDSGSSSSGSSAGSGSGSSSSK